MSMMSFIKKHWLILTLVSIAYFIYSSLVFEPWNLKHFSLTDDGQVLMQNYSFLKECTEESKCFRFIDQTLEFGTGRFRPAYWLIQDVLYASFGNDAELHHLFRVYVVGYAQVMLLTVILINFGTGSIAVFMASILYFTTYSFAENTIRLGPNEPYQVIFLALFSLIYLAEKKFASSKPITVFGLTALLVWTVLIKETNIAILPTIFLTEILFKNKTFLSKKHLILLGAPVISIVSIYITKKFVPSVISNDIPVYTSNYIFNPFRIAENSIILMGSLFNTLSPFLKISLLVIPILYIFKKTRKIYFDKKIVYWLLYSVFFVGIMFPWRYLLDRYLLVGIFGLCVLIGIVIDKGLFIIKEKLPYLTNSKLKMLTFNVVAILILVNLFSRGFSVNLAKSINYARWYAGFLKFEYDQVLALLRYNDSNIYINGVESIENWEFLYEIPIHHKFIYGVESKSKLVPEVLPKTGYLFSRSSFGSSPNLSPETLSRFGVVEKQNYSINQIDPLLFRSQFKMRPVATLVNPPLTKSYDYYWEVRSLIQK